MSESYDWLTHDHSEFESILHEFTDAIEQDAWAEADDLLAQLIEDLKSHICMEEEILYPAYEKHRQLPQEPVMALREEHDDIVRLLGDLCRVIKGRNSQHTMESMLPLDQALITHHEKEEHIFLPMAGQLLLPEKDEITRQLQALDIRESSRNWDI